MQHFDFVVVGQGLAGTAVAWHLRWAGRRVLVLDREQQSTASRVAAGLVTPVTGKRLARSWRYDEAWPEAVAFYARVEADLGCRCFRVGPAVRLFRDAAERARYDRRAGTILGGFVRDPAPPINPEFLHANHGAFQMSPAGRLDCGRYLDASRAHFARDGGYRRACFDPARDLDLSVERIRLPELGVTAEAIVFCQGIAGRGDPWFASVGLLPVKGEVLTVRVPELAERRVLHTNVWLAPIEGDTYRAGATYEREPTDDHPTARGRADITSHLVGMMRPTFEVVDHTAAVRPVSPDGRPFVGTHPGDQRVVYLNGLGSKGALHAPSLAATLLATLTTKTVIDANVDVRRTMRS